MPLRLQVGLEPAEQRYTIPTLPLQGPVAVKSLHELALPGHRQVTGDFAQPGEKQTLLKVSYPHVIYVKLSSPLNFLEVLLLVLVNLLFHIQFGI